MRQTFLMLLTFALATSIFAAAQNSRTDLDSNWRVQSSEKVSEDGAAISQPGYAASAKWYAATLPTTVVGALVADKQLPDPSFGTNLRSMPGVSYSIGGNFSHDLMPVESPFLVPWWFRTEFNAPAEGQRSHTVLHFAGINYRSNVWMNGKQIASADKMRGAYRAFEFDVTDAMKQGTNGLAVEIFPPQPTDLAITFVDWNPMPPDKEMGIWKDVYLTTASPVEIVHPAVTTTLDDGGNVAHATVLFDAVNESDRPVAGKVTGELGSARFSIAVTLAAHETKAINITPQDAPALNISHPRLWWPVQMGEPNLYDLQLSFEANGALSDTVSRKVGLRQVTSEMTPGGARLFKINGKNVLIRGAGWSSDILLRADPLRQEQEIQYVKDMNLNTIRLEGKLEDEHFFDLTDRYGILVMAGWCCCDFWEQWPAWGAEQYEVARASMHDQAMRLRAHPSVFLWLYGSDNPPTEQAEKMYLEALQQASWPNPAISSASAKPTALSGASGVKMSGPYDWVPPNYWFEDKQHGGAFGFNTETSPGPAPPPVASLRKFIPADHLWPIDKTWDYHAGGGEFSTIDTFSNALEHRYGKPNGVEDFAQKSQLMTYEGERAMFEAYRKNKYTSTGVIQWMLNNAWPSLIWHLYDYYLLPGGGYFGTKIANEPVHIQYSYDDRSVVVVNASPSPQEGLIAHADVYDLSLNRLWSRDAQISVGSDSPVTAFPVPSDLKVDSMYFVRLELARGKNIVSRNFYWLSAKPDVLEEEKSTWFMTPVSSFADFTALQHLPPVRLNVTANSTAHNTLVTTHVIVRNPSQHLALAIELRLTRSEDGSDITPALWDDNYFSLMPGEERTLNVSYDEKIYPGVPQLIVGGTNTYAEAAPVTSTGGRSR